MALSRAQAFVTKWWLALRHNLPFAWVYGVNVIWWLTLDRRPFEDPAQFAGVAELEEAWPEIREEFDRLRAATHTPMFGAIDPGQARLATDRWRAVLLWFWGQPSRTNLAECPRTAEVLSHIDGLQTALHSSLAPKASLPWHMGPYAGVLRVHLGIDVPPGGQCGIQVGRQRRYWRNGGLLVFDDTYPHTAWNHSDEERVVLFIDIVRPMPHRWQRRLNAAVLKHLSRTERIRGAAQRGDDLMRIEPEN